MASLHSWISPGILHALGWALLHSSWECLGVAALAAGLMAFSRRPAIRYLVGVAALAVMLAAPVATFLVLVKSATPVPLFVTQHGALPLAYSGSSVGAAPVAVTVYPVADFSNVIGHRVVAAFTQAPRPLPNMLPWLVGAWLCGVAFFSLRFAGAFLLLERRRRQRCAVVSPRILAMCQELQARLGIRRTIRYLECGWLQVPAVIGWIHPIVFLPLRAMTGLSEQQLRAVIAHELAHIRRFDMFVNLFQVLVETLLFYHPAMWWLNRRIRAERELCCDEIALSLCGDRLEYARALTLIAARSQAPALAMALGRGSLSERVFHIMGENAGGGGQRVLGLTGSVLVLAAALGAANALFWVACPLPAAHARERIRAALASMQLIGDAHAAPRLLPTTAITPDTLTPVRIGRNDIQATAPDLGEAAPDIAPSAPPPLVLAAADTPPQPVTSAAAPSGAPESITVTATPLPGRDAVDQFIYSFPTAARPTDKIARWQVGICPVVEGLPQHFADFITRRLVAIARKAGAPVNANPACRHNIQIVFTTRPQELANDLLKHHRPYLGYFDNLNQAAELAQVKHDIQAWYTTGTVGFDGQIRVDNPRADFLSTDPYGHGKVFYAAGFGRFNNGVGSTLCNVVIAADPGKLADYEMGSLADYIAMLALSQPKDFDDCWEVPSITNLLSRGCAKDRKTQTLSDNDAAFLYGLYKMSPTQNIFIKRDQIRYFLERNPPKS